MCYKFSVYGFLLTFELFGGNKSTYAHPLKFQDNERGAPQQTRNVEKRL